MIVCPNETGPAVEAVLLMLRSRMTGVFVMTQLMPSPWAGVRLIGRLTTPDTVVTRRLLMMHETDCRYLFTAQVEPAAIASFST